MKTTTACPSAADERTHPRRALAAIAGANALAAWFGCLGLVTGALSLGHGIDSRLPLGSPVLAGVALAVVVALPLTFLARCAWTGDARTDEATTIAGLLLVGWIVVQLVFIRTFSWFQPFYGALGVAFVAVGVRRLRTR